MHIAVTQIYDIDLDDRYFKIGRDTINEDLRASIRNFGVLDPPSLIRKSDRFQVVFGFNRLGILKELGQTTAQANVLESMNTEWYVRSALLQCHRNETGPLGRLRTLYLLKHSFELGADRIMNLARNGLRLPDYFLQGDTLLSSVMELPRNLRRYIDDTNVTYRVIRDLAGMHEGGIRLISKWMDYSPIRVNIFKSIVEMLSEINARDGGLGVVEHVAPEGESSGTRWDERLAGLIYRARYPEYSSLKRRADEIVRRYSAAGIQVRYPSYFEGDRIDLTFSLKKQDDPATVKKKLEAMDTVGLRELLDLL
jgi:hypothetical protein